jgi:hypothetical protein
MMTYKKILAELEAELQLSINKNEFVTPQYFTGDIIDAFVLIRDCNCNKRYLTHQAWKELILDILLSYKERDDFMDSCKMIFSPVFLRYETNKIIG